MLRSNLPRAVRHLRRRRGWRQQDLADAAGVSRPVVSRIERGVDLGGLSLRTISRVAQALDASAAVTVSWQGEELNRLIDSGHAAIVADVVRELESRGWTTRVEVSFNHFGDRGRVDVLAMDHVARTLLVVEAKTAIGDMQDTLGRIDVKTRLGPEIARSVGWGAPRASVPALVIGDSRASRRLVMRHGAVLARFDLRGRQARAWLRAPASRPISGLLWFVKVPDDRGASITRRTRVRLVQSRR